MRSSLELDTLRKDSEDSSAPKLTIDERNEVPSITTSDDKILLKELAFAIASQYA